jgi:hypothetical protein
MKPYLLTTIAILCLASAAHAETTYIKGSSNYGCVHKVDYDKTNEYVAQNDRDAFTQFLGLGIATGVCVMFEANEPVTIADRGLFTSKVRRKGNLAEYWISSKALQ